MTNSQDSQTYRYNPEESDAPTPIPHEAAVNATKADQRVNELWDFASHQLPSLALAHLVGYGLLFFAFLALIDLLIPPQLLNPVWELQAIGGVVERVVPISLMGTVLLFWGGNKARQGWEKPLLGGLSWLSIVVSLLLFLLLPLGIINTVRVDRQTQTEIQTQLDQQAAQFEQVQTAIQSAQTPEQVAAIIQQLDSENRAVAIEDPGQVDALKGQLTDSVANFEANVKQQADAALKQRRMALLKNSIKWNIAALVSSLLFLSVWQLTAWARR